MEIRYSDEVPSFLEARPPLIQHPFMRPRPAKGINLLEKFEEDSDTEELDLVQVFLRMKPCKIPNNLYEIRSDKCLVTSLDSTTAGHGRRTQHNVSKMYTFSHIFKPECTQKEVFEQVVKNNMKRLVDGYSFTLLTYGASGSGKTYTLMGTVQAPGLVPRALEYLFKLIDAAQTPSFKPSENGTDQLSHHQQELELQSVNRLLQISAPFRAKYRRMSAQLLGDLTISSSDLAKIKKHYVWVSFVEIYNEAVYDLLVPPDKRAKLRLREDSTGNVYVKGVTQTFVRSGEEAYDVMVAGKHNLVVAETGIHAQSSRSHCIFTITMLTENDGELRTSHMRFCDLAGCERQRAARNTGARMLESRAINSSLHVLERCLHMLRRKQLTNDSAMVPYRECKLTRILGSGLSGARGEAVTMVVTVNPAPQYAHETKHVLSLAVVAKDIQVNNTIDPTVTMSSLESTQDSTMQDYQDEIQKLRTENERLHFEILQAQSCIAQLRNAMEEKRQQSASTMKDIVEETKDMMSQFYDKQLATLRSQKKKMEDEYESKIADLEQENRRLRLEMKEMQDNRQEILPESIEREDSDEEDALLNPEPVYTTDSETETDLDESLEPIKQLRKSILHRDTPEKREPVTDLIIELSEEESESDELENEDINDKSASNKPRPVLKTSDMTIEDEIDKSNTEYFNVEKDKSECEAMFNVSTKLNKTQEMTDKDNRPTNPRNTYFVKNGSQEDYNIDPNLKTLNVFRGTYYVPNREISIFKEIDTLNLTDNNKESTAKIKESSTKTNESLTKCIEVPTKNEQYENEIMKPKKIPETLVSKIMKSFKTRQSSESSLRQFEQLELAVKNTDSSTDAVKSFEINIPTHKMKKKAYFDESVKELSVEINEPSEATGNRSDEKAKYSEDKSDESNHYNQVYQAIELQERRLLLDSSESSSTSPDKQDKSKHLDNDNNVNIFQNLTITPKVVKEAQLYFTEKDKVVPKDILISKSPSIIKDNTGDEYVSRVAVKKILGESFMKPDIISSTRKKSLFKKQDSLDIFESPLSCTTKGNSKNQNNIDEIARNNGEEHNAINGNSKKQNNIAEIANNNGEEHNAINTEIISVSNLKERAGEIAHEFIESLLTSQKMKAYDQREALASVNNFSIGDSTPVSVNKNGEENKNINQGIKEIKQEITLERTYLPEITEEIIQIKQEQLTLEKTSLPELSSTENIQKRQDYSANSNQLLNDTETSNRDNTVDEFEKIVKDLTSVRATDFELLVTNEDLPPNDKSKQNIDITIDKPDTKEKTEMDERTKKFEEAKYNLRNKQKPHINILDDKKEMEQTSESSKKRTTFKSLRLRKRRNDENIEKDTDKINSIINLKMEFSDVTMGLPAIKKDVKDIPSPEKMVGEEENIPPTLGIQSCPSKSVTRSRRKLFTPRAEPLEESPSHATDTNSNERIYVPRPSYHKPRARRKL